MRGLSRGSTRRIRWERTRLARAIGDVLFWTACRIHDRWLDLEVIHAQRAERIPIPSLIVLNYPAPYAALMVLRAIPRSLRHRIATAADAAAWSGRRRWQGALLALVIGAFPLGRTTRTTRAGIASASAWLADGYAVLILPEGGPSMSEEPRPFLRGVGLLATRMGVPVVPFRVEGYAALYPEHDVPFPWLPRRRGTVRLVVGEPFRIPAGTTSEDATELARRAVFALGSGDAPVGAGPSRRISS